MTSYPPEPPDGTRIEFEYFTDVYAAWRDDKSSHEAGWPTGDGGKNWVIYGESVPWTWAELCDRFQEDPLAIAQAIRLVPVAEDEHLREKWPTQVYAASKDPNKRTELAKDPWDRTYRSTVPDGYNDY